MRKLKRGGVDAFSPQIAEPLRELLISLQGYGVFLVPVGELEEWLTGTGIQASKENKWAWANEAALHIQSVGASAGDIWNFIRDVGSHLVEKLSSRHAKV
jgi:hypothetical protein